MAWKIESRIGREIVLTVGVPSEKMMTTRALFLKLFVSALIALPVFAQTPAAPPPAFDAVSIKPNKSGSGSTSVHTDDVHFRATNISLKSLIRDAYDLQSEDQVVGLPAWTNSVNFDINAKIDAETLAMMKAASKEEAGRMRNEMMKATLAERFQLKVHPETKELPMYDLVLAKGGSKMKDADPKTEGGNMNSNNQKLTVTGIPMSSLCNYLSRRLHRQVTDKTGLTGRYDFVLEWSPDEAAGETPATGGSTLPSLFTALQEELGLKLESTKGPVDTIVVDKVEMPSEN
jgi:uncharacterized protein (TIGR03435 family)